jgi:AcrR family transcriptional regulator
VTEAAAESLDAGARARARLERAAVVCFAENGFHGTSTRDIAAAAGMSPAALYVHYPSKHELLFRIAHRGHEQALAAVLGTASTATRPGHVDGPAGEAVQRLVRLVRDFVGFHAEHPTEARIVNYEFRALRGEQRRRIEALRGRIDAAVREAVDDGIAAGAFRVEDPRLAAAALVSLGVDVSRWYDPAGHWTPDQLADEFCAIALRIVGARGPAA